jgi:DNA-binding NarL/FixJ family response regulator
MSPTASVRRAGPVRVLVVDDQLVFRQVARQVVEATRDFELVGEADSAESGVAAAAELRPDLVLIDVRMPDVDGIEAASRIRSGPSEAVVVLVSVEEPPNLPRGASSCGAAAVVRKQDFGPTLLRSIWSAHRP